MTFQTNKTLGGIGAILLLIGLLISPFGQFFAGGAIAIIGIILVLIALYGFANYYGDRGIFTNALFGVLAAIVGAVVAGAVALFVVVTSLKDFLYQIFPGWDGNWSSLQGLTPDTSNLNPSAILPFLTGIILVLIVGWVFAIIATFFLRRSLKSLGNRSGVGLFGTAGLLFLIGAVLLVILIGIFVIWIAAIVLAIAFFTMKPRETYPEQSATINPPPTSPPPTSV